jgi:DNA-binding IclR family transcriptional regulator
MMLATGDTTIVIRHMKSSSAKVPLRWSLLTNHGHVLAYVAGHSDARLRDIAESIGITERTVAQIVNDLEEAGHLTKTRDGRRNRYEIDGGLTIQAPRLSTMPIAQLLGLLLAALEKQPFA